MMKRCICLLSLVCCLLLSAGMLYGCGSGHPDSDAGNTGGTGEQESVARVDGFILYPDEEGTFYSVGGYEGEGGTLLVPAEYDGLPVSEIGGAAFMNNGEIRSVVLPDSVKTIGEESFRNCTSLTSVTIPGGVEEIGYNAFAGCTGLTGLTFPDGLVRISANAFYGCSSLVAVAIPDSVTAIGERAFAGCSGLKSLSLGGGVGIIGGGAFSGCTGLSSLTIPDLVLNIEYLAFENCTGLISITIAQGAEVTISDSAFTGCGNITAATIPACAAKFIPKTSLETVVITGGETIESNSFRYASRLQSVDLPDSVVEIGVNAFESCSSLTEIHLPDSLKRILAGAFRDCAALVSVTVPEQVELIGSEAFRDCTALGKIYWNAVSAGDLNRISFTFENAGTAAGGMELIIGDRVERIPAHLFSHDDVPANLVFVSIGDGVTDIGEQAFAHCGNLVRIRIGRNVKNLGNKAFYRCTRLTELEWNAAEAKDLTDSSMLFYDAGTEGEGMTVTFGDEVIRIPAHLFGIGGINAPKIFSMTIGEQVTEIGACAFSGLYRLNSLSFGGTRAQWLAIAKGIDWNSGTGPYTVLCTDGSIAKT